MATIDAGTGRSAEPISYKWWDQIPVDPATGKPTLATKTQLSEQKLKPGSPPVATIGYGRGRRERCYDLYAVADAKPKRVMSEAARAKALAALEAAHIKKRTCSDCKQVKETLSCLQYGQCYDCIERERENEFREMRREDKDDCILWARRALAKPFYVVDTETTGLLETSTAEIIEIAVIDSVTGDAVFETLVKPRHGMDATWIHGIGGDDVANAPDAREVWQQVAALLTGGRPLYAYSCDFDDSMVGRMIRAAHWDHAVPVAEPPRIDTYFHVGLYGGYVRGKDGKLLTWADALPSEAEAAEHGLMCRTSEEAADMTAAQDRFWDERNRTNHVVREIEKSMVWSDIMEPYSAFCGQWHSYFRSYTWQPLGGGHRAAGDARAALSVIWQMATGIYSADGLDGEGI
ncbi:MAG: 3'-5' exonuclease [Fibrella sp.]|nr:3'-5' exonuclease [Armatimonadota bacterium]